MTDRLARKAVVLVLAGLGAAVVVVAASRPWATGTLTDAVLGHGRVAATGGEAAPGIVALALVVAGAALAGVTAGRVGRVLALVLYAGGLLGAAALTVRALLHPEAVLGPIAAAAVGRSGWLAVRPATSAWPWVALGGLLVGGLGWLGMLLGARRWSGLSARYETPAAQAPGSGGTPVPSSTPRPGARGERVASDWDALSEGVDPTTGPSDRHPDPAP